MTGFLLKKDEEGFEYIQCKTCSLKSYHHKDIEHKFCGKCNKFHKEEKDNHYEYA